MLANWLTLARLPLLLLTLLALYLGPPQLQLAGAGLLFIGFLLDTIDGLVARRKGQSSLLGSVLDIAADRTYELALWVVFADLRLVPTALALVVIGRTALTDALRSLEVGRGIAPLAQEQSTLGRFLVGSPWMRTGYSASKITTFCGLAVAHALMGWPDAAVRQFAEQSIALLQVGAWLTVLLCLGRGLPVLVGSLRRHWKRAPTGALVASSR
jgi:phosphatidylglycerophosphate synthase